MNSDRDHKGIARRDGDKWIDAQGHAWEWSSRFICREHKHAECAMNNGKECTP